MILILFLILGNLSHGATGLVDEKIQPEAVEMGDPAALKVVQALTLGVLTRNRALIEANALPVEGLSILWKGKSPPQEIQETMMQSVKGMTLHVCVPGHEHDLPGGARLKVEASMATDGILTVFPILEGQMAPLPWVLHKVAEDWKVDVGPLIVARHRAKEMMEKRNSKR